MKKGVFAAVKKDGSVYYRASITFRCKHISLGSFTSESEAHGAYQSADKLLSATVPITPEDYQETQFPLLPFSKWISLLNFKNNGIYIKTPIYLRKKYFEADVVISGANYVLAEEGAIVLATNEGNARFSMAGAKTHIAIAGFEKVIPSARELAVFLNLLGRSATAQNSTVYTDFVAGAGLAKNSPQEMFVIFLDNGRSDILKSEFSDILKCMRCGACMNRCPVFRLVGGHAYRAVYPGPLGIVLSPLLAGADIAKFADLPKACSLCGKCADVCPAKIPLPDLILKMRDKIKKAQIPVPNDINFKPWAFFASSPKLWRTLMPLNKIANLFPLDAIKIGPLGRWLKFRTLPKFNGGYFRKWFNKNG